MTGYMQDKYFPVPVENYKNMVIISSPSGGGKNTLINILMKNNNHIEHSISTTSRKPRGDESEGNPYYFVSAEKFQEMVSSGEFLEWAPVLDNFYGTTYKEIHRILKKSNIALLDIDVQGAAQIKKTHPEVTTIFIDPPSLEILEQRLRRRGTENEEQISKRLKLAQIELSKKAEYDYVITNDIIERASAELLGIINKI